MCKFCTHGDEWDYNAIPIDAGDFGSFEIALAISAKRKQLSIEVCPENTDPIFNRSIGIKFCPFCGEELK